MLAVSLLLDLYWPVQDPHRLTSPYGMRIHPIQKVEKFHNGVDLAESYAYSDSVYDTPMLAAVGHPFVVNPDPRMVLVAAARRWPTINFDVSPGVIARHNPALQPTIWQGSKHVPSGYTLRLPRAELSTDPRKLLAEPDGDRIHD